MLFNPYYFARRGLSVHLREIASRIEGRTLDIGCGAKPYAGFCRSDLYVGLDIWRADRQGPCRADVYYGGGRFPFGDHAFDSVLLNQVLEHVFEPDEFLAEVNRILKPGGHLLLTVPLLWGEHEKPFDCARYSSFGIRHLLVRHGFDILTQRKTMADIRAPFCLATAGIYERVSSRGRLSKLATAVFICGPLNVCGALLKMVVPTTGDIYLDNIVLGKKRM